MIAGKTATTPMPIIILLAIIILGSGKIALAKQLSPPIPLENGDYTTYNDILIIAKTNNTKIIIIIYNITDNKKNSYTLDTGLRNIILDLKLDNNGTLHILAYTEPLGRKIIIIYNYNLSNSKISRTVIDITGNLNSSVKGGVIIKNNIIIISKYKLLIYNIKDKTLINSVNVIKDYRNMYIDEVREGVYIVYITQSNKSIIYYYNGSNINMNRVNYITLDIDDNGKYMSVYNGSKYIILSYDNKQIIRAKGIIGSLCHVGETLFYGISYKGINALNMLNLSLNKNYMLINTESMVVDISCSESYLIVTYANKSVQVLGYDIVRDALLLEEDSVGEVVDNTTMNSTDSGNTVSLEDRRVTYLKISSFILGIVVLVLAYKVIRSMKSRY